MEADVTADKKSRERTEGAAPAVQAKHEDSSSAKRVQAGPTSSTSLGKKAEPPALPRRDDVLVDIGSTAPKPCSLTHGDAHANSRRWLISHRQNLYSDDDHCFRQLPLWFCLTKEIKSRTLN